MRTEVCVIFHIFPLKSFQTKKIKELRPKMTKIASRDAALAISTLYNLKKKEGEEETALKIGKKIKWCHQRCKLSSKL